MGAKTSQELLDAISLVRSGMTPYGAAKALKAEGKSITPAAIYSSRQYREMMAGYLIAEAPMDGTFVYLRCDTHPEYGEHLMCWSRLNKRWECQLFAPMGARIGWWDETCEPPTHFRPRA